jgi:hypothetical protein
LNPAAGLARLSFMRMRFLLVFAALVGVNAQNSVDPRELVRQAFAQDENIFNSVQDYTYVENSTTRNLDSKGKVTSVEREGHEILYLYGREYEKLISKDGKPLSAGDARKEDEKAEREIQKRQREAERGDTKRQDDVRSRRRRTALEVADAFDFKLVGSEQAPGGIAWIIDATPRPGYKAKTRESKLFAKTSGRLWINQTEKSLAKAQIRVDDTISFGYFLFRLKPGARIEFERTRLAQNVWLPKHAFVKGEAKVGMLKTFRVEVETEYSDYKKFQTESSFSVAGAP